MEKVRWGVVSTASIAQTQVIPAINRSENAEMVGIASRDEKAKAVAARLSIPKSFESYEELLRDSEIDAVYIPLPNHLHSKWVKKAAGLGKHVLCEKPAALTTEETGEMAAFCKQKDIKFMEAFMYQFHPQHQRVQEIIADGEIGEIKFMRASFSFYMEDKQSNIRMKKEMGGGSIYDVGCYCIHAIRSILHTEPIEVETFATLDPHTGVDLSALVHMKLANGIMAVFDCSFDMAFRQEYEVVGTKGRISVPRAFRPDTYGGEGFIIVQSEQGDRTEKITGDQYKLQIEHFSQSIMENTQPSYSAENTILNMRAIDACYQSICQKAAVVLA
ncbi:Gfo/Idh/MocA family oxidoreductase [Neobacillus sp. OS1-2]|uniref:Gfo/Idh/MocA family protein n=1 Tax=Neobacillus sp. OS1-2 TaxID=3070680 RepID=UPI0027DF6247|nr:Gfo/Idh/MocA family oxidoreductase [Neobacillus sp. OS1-2]WML41317.1 Gfo/Idh/MocA family oxidoreductase [Neobacillus sp. OS1-2]